MSDPSPTEKLVFLRKVKNELPAEMQAEVTTVCNMFVYLNDLYDQAHRFHKQMIAFAQMDVNEGPPIESIPNEILLKVFSYLEGRTLMVYVPQVCKLWRRQCPQIRNVFLDLSWWHEMIPLEVLHDMLTGWPLPAPEVDGGGSAAAEELVQQEEEGRWVSGLCELFPHTTSIAMSQEGADAHVMTLAGKWRDLKYANFSGCFLTDATVLALADMCGGLTRAGFGHCGDLTDVAVRGLAKKCSGLTHVNFNFCVRLTDAAVLELADKCELTYADFGNCIDLTDAAVRGLADKCIGLTYANFERPFCDADSNLTDATKAAVKAQLPNCTWLL